jgi:hypothetical protein
MSAGRPAPGTQAGDRPVDVEIVNQLTGERLPCELAYDRLDAEGIHRWVVATPLYPDVEKVTIAVLPPRTRVGFEVLLPGSRPREESDDPTPP